MNSHHLEIAFNKMIHPDLKGILSFSFENWDNNSKRGQVVFMEDFETIYICGFNMTQILNWYLKYPKKNHPIAKNSNNSYERALSLMDRNTGSRHIDDYIDDKDEFVQIIYNLRKKFI